MTKQYFDVGVLIPLQEEFRYAKELLPGLESIHYEGTYFYRFDLPQVSAICCLVGQMGTLPAMNVAQRLLKFADVRLLVLLGLAGAIDDSVAVGDLVVAEEVNEYQASSKAKSTADGYEVQYSGRHWSLDFEIREAVRHFEYSYPECFNSWQTAVADDFSALDARNKETVCSLPPKLHIGPIASGNIVAASTAFLEEVRRINRKFVAIDMEAAGVAFAATERTHRVPWLVLRGISDRGDEYKTDLDNQNQVWRRYSVRNAVSFLLGLLSWEGFRLACGIDSASAETRSEQLVKDLVLAVASHVGAPWLVGIAFGIYTHGPRISGETNIVPMDLSRLRTLDGMIGRLIDSSTEVRDRLLLTGDLEVAAKAFEALAENYRNQVGSSNVDPILRDFDRVIMETLSPSDDDQVGELLLEADRLEEDIGPEAAAEYLSELSLEDTRLRQRYVSALDDSRNWTAIINVLKEIHFDDMSRVECEALIFAYANNDDFKSVKSVLEFHHNRYEEASAQMFRRQVTAQFAGLRENVCEE